MSNVLPHTQKTRVVQSVRARIVTVAAFALALAGAVGSVALTPAYLGVSLSNLELTVPAPASDSDAAANEAEKKSIARFRALFDALAPLAEGVHDLDGALALMASEAPRGVTLQTIVYRAGEPATLVVSGSAASRDLVGAYRDALVAVAYFENVSVPVAALVGAAEGAFTITATGAF